MEQTDNGTGNAFGLRTVRNTEDPFAAATAGLRYTYAPAEEDWSATLAGQYLWNGEGYDDPAVLRDNRAGVAALLAAGDLSGADLAFRGRHYAAASLNVALGRGADWSAGVLWLSNLSDGSARVAPSVTFRPLDYLSLRAAATVAYGDEGAEMTPFGSRIGASLTATLGSGPMWYHSDVRHASKAPAHAERRVRESDAKRHSMGGYHRNVECGRRAGHPALGLTGVADEGCGTHRRSFVRIRNRKPGERRCVTSPHFSMPQEWGRDGIQGVCRRN